MTNQQKLQAVEEKIRELCPELMELNEGCKMFCTSPKLIREYGLGEIGMLVGNSFKGRFYYDNGASVDALFVVSGREKQNFEIIGHDITLESVLKISDLFWHDGEEVGEWYLIAEANGEVMQKKFVNSGMIAEKVFDWQLGIPLHQQKPEVVDFLYQIFKLNEDV